MIKENSCSQIIIITRITAFACLLSMSLSFKLWLGNRNFPVAPLFSFLPELNHPLDIILLCSTGILLLCIILFRKSQGFVIAFVIIGILLGLMDQNRWQPWYYQYLLMFFLLSFFNYRCDDMKHQTAIVSTFKLMIAAVYFWSGLQKLNPHFLSDTYPWLMEPVTNYLGEKFTNKIQFLGYAFPLIETLTGICLLIPALQKAAAISALLMHTFILFVLSPLGHNYNPVVWPWNLAMIAFVLVLFYNENITDLLKFRNSFRYFSSKLAIGLFVFAPLLNFFNIWDSYLSHNLYSGNTSNGVVYFPDSVKNNLPPYLRQYVVKESKENLINIKYWCMTELGVPAYPEKRNFEAVTKMFYAYTNDSSSIYLMYSPKLKIRDL
jgi:uncharacterized membrane protein YphA (DoxX/SURF4 family)